ncbi:MAG: hypothetical protein GX970_16360 [Phyllobacteriaceae bacterium]|nr:hypothetical protein [Phyllobacteriaceae bacterium]
MTVEICDRACLAKMFHAERAGSVAVDGAKPAERCRMTIDHRNETAMGWDVSQQTLDMARRMDESALARALRRGPPRIETVS